MATPIEKLSAARRAELAGELHKKTQGMVAQCFTVADAGRNPSVQRNLHLLAALENTSYDAQCGKFKIPLTGLKRAHAGLASTSTAHVEPRRVSQRSTYTPSAEAQALIDAARDRKNELHEPAEGEVISGEAAETLAASYISKPSQNNGSPHSPSDASKHTGQTAHEQNVWQDIMSRSSLRSTAPKPARRGKMPGRRPQPPVALTERPVQAVVSQPRAVEKGTDRTLQTDSLALSVADITQKLRILAQNKKMIGTRISSDFYDDELCALVDALHKKTGASLNTIATDILGCSEWSLKTRVAGYRSIQQGPAGEVNEEYERLKRFVAEGKGYTQLQKALDMDRTQLRFLLRKYGLTLLSGDRTRGGAGTTTEVDSELPIVRVDVSNAPTLKRLANEFLHTDDVAGFVRAHAQELGFTDESEKLAPKKVGAIRTPKAKTIEEGGSEVADIVRRLRILGSNKKMFGEKRVSGEFYSAELCQLVDALKQKVAVPFSYIAKDILNCSGWMLAQKMKGYYAEGSESAPLQSHVVSESVVPTPLRVDTLVPGQLPRDIVPTESIARSDRPHEVPASEPAAATEFGARISGGLGSFSFANVRKFLKIRNDKLKT